MQKKSEINKVNSLIDEWTICFEKGAHSYQFITNTFCNVVTAVTIFRLKLLYREFQMQMDF